LSKVDVRYSSFTVACLCIGVYSISLACPNVNDENSSPLPSITSACPATVVTMHRSPLLTLPGAHHCGRHGPRRAHWRGDNRPRMSATPNTPLEMCLHRQRVAWRNSCCPLNNHLAIPTHLGSQRQKRNASSSTQQWYAAQSASQSSSLNRRASA